MSVVPSGKARTTTPIAVNRTQRGGRTQHGTEITMSLQAITWAFAQHETTPTQRLVLLALADHATPENESWPSIGLLIEKTGLSQATIYRAISDMRKAGVIEEVESVKGYRAWELLISQGENDFSQSENGSSQGENRTTYKEPNRTQDEPASSASPDPEEIVKVWTHYIGKPGKQDRPLPAEERKLIRDALKVATADELCSAIDGCWASDFHMKRGRYRDRDGQRYDKLSQIIKGRRGQETTRERIDFFLEIQEKAGVAGSGLPSADPAVIARRKRDVQRGHRFADDPVAVRKAEEAEAWLRERGIDTIRDETPDAYPTFRDLSAP